MLDTITQDLAAARPATALQVVQPGEAWPAHLERRRPGRNDDASPELIALMRKPTAEARLRVMLYDAPNFVLPDADAVRGRNRHHAMHLAAAIAACSLVWAAVFRGMMMLWG